MARPLSQVCIAGAGIAGMSASLALAAKGIGVTLLEKAAALEEVGAGIQLAPNATSLLRAWGVLDSLYGYAVEPETISLKDGLTGKTLLHMDMRFLPRKRWNAPYLVIHRADLQAALKAAIDKSPLISLRTGHEITGWASLAASGFQADIVQGEKAGKISAPLLVFCDGVWSQMRARLGEQALFSGYIAWRATLAVEDVPAGFLQISGAKTISAWVGKTGHFIAYPLKKGKIYNFVAITRERTPGLTWSKKEDVNKLLRLFAGWHPVIAAIIKQTQAWTFWPLFKMPFARFLGPSGEIFLGDASHAVTPFAAQGAAMAMEDAAALATALSAGDMPCQQALSLFDKERKKRLKAVARRGDVNCFVYHASGPLALARNLVMTMRPAEKFLTDLDWLYGYDAMSFCRK